MMKKCICQVCCCGRHRCPHTLGQQNRVINKNELRNCHVTEYKGRFEEISPKRGPFRRPVDLIKREGKTNSDTTNSTAYLPHKVEAPKLKEPETFVPNPHRFDATSEHQENYKHLEGVPARIPPYLKSSTMRKPSAKIHYVSTKQDDFKRWSPACRRPDAVTREKPYRPPSKPFQGTSIHRQDFTRFNQAPNPSARQPDKLNFGDNPVSFQTTNRSFHKPLDVIKMRPVERRSDDSDVSPPKSAFTSTSVFRSDFVNHKAIKSAHMFKPASVLFKTDDPMDSETTQGNAFKVWPVSKQERKAPDVYKKPEGLIEIKPTSSDYAHHGAQGIPAKSARPRTKLQRGREFPFNPTTSYSVEFKIHEKQLPARGRLKRETTDGGNEIFPKSEQSGGTVATSEFLDKFKRHQVAPARMFKGNSSLFKTTASLDVTSLYTEQFRGERIECPSERLLRNGNFGAFSFDHVTEEGHKVYEISPRGADNLRREMTVA